MPTHRRPSDDNGPQTAPALPGRPRTAARVRLVGEDGNAFAILARVRRAMKDADVPRETVDAFRREATSGDYSHLLATVMEYCEVVN